jgi:uncharacterized membrane protein
MTTLNPATQPTRLDDVRPQPEVDRETPQPGSEINVAWNERRLSLLGGLGLAFYGITRRSIGGAAVALLGGALVHRAISGNSKLYSALGISTAKSDGAREPEEYFDHGIHIEQSVTILRDQAELFRFWRDFQNLPRFMEYVKSVEVLDDKRSRWTVQGPVGTSLKWDAEIINEEPNQLIAWRTLGGADVDVAGSVRFVPAPEDRGTEVRVVIDYIPPTGKFGDVVAKLLGDSPSGQIREDLRHFKQLMEAGEIPTIQGQPKGTCKGSGKSHSGL